MRSRWCPREELTDTTGGTDAVYGGGGEDEPARTETTIRGTKLPMTATTMQAIAEELRQRAIWYDQPLDYTAGVNAVIREIERNLEIEALSTDRAAV